MHQPQICNSAAHGSPCPPSPLIHPMSTHGCPIHTSCHTHMAATHGCHTHTCCRTWLPRTYMLPHMAATHTHAAAHQCAPLPFTPFRLYLPYTFQPTAALLPYLPENRVHSPNWGSSLGWPALCALAALVTGSPQPALLIYCSASTSRASLLNAQNIRPCNRHTPHAPSSS